MSLFKAELVCWAGRGQPRSAIHMQPTRSTTRQSPVSRASTPPSFVSNSDPSPSPTGSSLPPFDGAPLFRRPPRPFEPASVAASPLSLGRSAQRRLGRVTFVRLWVRFARRPRRYRSRSPDGHSVSESQHVNHPARESLST
eukprot:Selendium_serpulae@DN9710_c0_g1_i1.p1